MTWEQQLAACQSLCEHSLRMRKPGDWYVSASSLTVKSGDFQKGRYGNGETPEMAVADHWNKITKLKDKEYVFVYRGKGHDAYKWNGYMWKQIPEEGVTS
ncbi:MAG: hypothetical protein OEY77_00065 [Nitrospira sp.]|nr:hypothetical protein [Nitrospira sp.]